MGQGGLRCRAELQIAFGVTTEEQTQIPFGRNNKEAGLKTQIAFGDDSREGRR